MTCKINWSSHSRSHSICVSAVFCNRFWHVHSIQCYWLHLAFFRRNLAQTGIQFNAVAIFPLNGPYLPSPLTRPPKTIPQLVTFFVFVMKKIRSGSYHNINKFVKAFLSNLSKPEILRPFSEFQCNVETWLKWNNDWMKLQRTFSMNPSFWNSQVGAKSLEWKPLILHWRLRMYFSLLLVSTCKTMDIKQKNFHFTWDEPPSAKRS